MLRYDVTCTDIGTYLLSVCLSYGSRALSLDARHDDSWYSVLSNPSVRYRLSVALVLQVASSQLGMLLVLVFTGQVCMLIYRFM